MPDSLSVFDRILGIDWFSNAGKPVEVSPSFKVVRVSTWNEAVSECGGEVWADLQLEERNRLTGFLSAKHRHDYRNWNLRASEAKERLALDFQNLDRRVAELGIDEIVSASAKWDVLHAAMEESYAEFSPPTFFKPLIEFYVSGNFPCGWRGDRQSGTLVVF